MIRPLLAPLGQPIARYRIISGPKIATHRTADAVNNPLLSRRRSDSNPRPWDYFIYITFQLVKQPVTKLLVVDSISFAEAPCTVTKNSQILNYF
jgi:hypothetical protein